MSDQSQLLPVRSHQVTTRERRDRTEGSTMRTSHEPAVYRDVLGHFASGITVITGLTGEGPVGFTCQSFSSLSLDPALVVLLPSRTSTSWPRISRCSTFGINVLADKQQHLSAAFAHSGGDKFDGVSWVPGRHGAPRLSGSCAWLECAVVDVHDGGDHFIVVGEVLELDADPTSAPLVYHRGSYGRLVH